MINIILVVAGLVLVYGIEGFNTLGWILTGLGAAITAVQLVLMAGFLAVFRKHF